MSSVHAQPAFSHSQVTEIIKRLFDLTLSKIQPLPSYDDQNFHVVTDDGVDYVLKIMNSEDSKNFDLIDVQTYAMSFLHQNGLPTQTAVPTTTGQLLTLEEIGRKTVTDYVVVSTWAKVSENCSSCWIFERIKCPALWGTKKSLYFCVR